jgi:hypothetical protein
MISFFPDLNVWLALSVSGHRHSAEAWRWLAVVPREARLIFSRYTQIGLLRLLTNPSVMGPQTLTLGQAWDVYDRWLRDPRVELYPEPRGLEASFREATAGVAGQTASKCVGDCYLMAYSGECRAALVTFDQALFALARDRGFSAVVPG